MPRVAGGRQTTSDRKSEVFLNLFPTEVGWMGIAGQVNVVRSVSIGHASEAAVRKVMRQSWQAHDETDAIAGERDWYPDLREALEQYAAGERVTFDQFELQLPDQTPFRDKVLAATRRLAYGQTTTYGDLARIVGHPRAARAVGTVMATNRFPILIPCHRVLAAGNKLGGYTSPAGTELKQRLLDMEQAH